MHRPRVIGIVCAILLVSPICNARADSTAVDKIKDEGLNRSQVMQTLGYLTDVNGTLFFTALDGTHGFSIFKSDPAGNVKFLKDTDPTNVNAPGPTDLTNINGTLFFQANDGVNGTELWKSDGTAAGTVIVKDILPGSSTSNRGRAHGSSGDARGLIVLRE